MDLEGNLTGARTCSACGHSYSYGHFEDYQQCRISNGEPCGVCNKLKYLEPQILKAKRTLDELVSQYQGLKTQRNHIHDPVTSRIPSEVVSYIFQLCLPPLPLNCGPVYTLGKEVVSEPLKLGAVCRAWRKIAWATPRLWTVLRFCISALGFPARCDLARQWLVRSGGLPLTIYIFASTSIIKDVGKPRASPDVINSFIKLVNQYSSRWCQLCLRIPSSLLIQFCGDSTSHSTLHTLYINPSHRPRRHQTRFIGHFSMNNVKPSPSNVWISSLSFNAVDIEWNNVTQVVFGSLRVDECFELLKRASKLIRCEFLRFSRSLPDEEQFPVPEYTIIHHQIRIFYLTYPVNLDAVSLFFDKVRFPALVDLSCTMECFLPTESLVSFFKHSSCLIEEFSLNAALFDEDGDIIDLLLVIPSLRRLKLLSYVWSHCAPDRLFERLARTSIADDDEDAFLPELRSFSCREDHQDIRWDHLPKIIGPLCELDNPRRRPLNSVQIHLDRYDGGRRYIDKDVLLHLLSILEAGLDFTIEYPDGPVDLIKASVKYHEEADDDEDFSSSEE